MAERSRQRAEVERLADELFREVEAHLGYFHVSDGETFATKREFFKRIRGRLAHGQMAVHKMRAFLKRYNELPERPR